MAKQSKTELRTGKGDANTVTDDRNRLALTGN